MPKQATAKRQAKRATVLVETLSSDAVESTAPPAATTTEPVMGDAVIPQTDRAIAPINNSSANAPKDELNTMTNAAINHDTATDEIDESAMELDFETIKELDPLNGTFLASIKRCALGKGKESGIPLFNVQWEIKQGVDREGNDVTDESEGRIVFDTLSFAKKALFRMKALMLALGFPANFKGRPIAEDFIGGLAVIVVATEQGTGINPTTREKYPARAVVKAYKHETEFQGIDGILDSVAPR